MHGFKRLTLVAFLMWGGGMLISAVVPWQVIEEGRSVLAVTSKIGETANRDTGTPRILIIGSSPAVLGLSAGQIAAKTGLPTFNLGAIGAVSFFPEYFDTALAFVRPDDVVVLSDPNWLARGNAVLAKGCIGSFDFSCAVWRPRPLPHLAAFAGVLLGRWFADTAALPRDGIGDAVAVRSSNTGQTIPTLPYTGQFSNEIAAELRQAVEKLRAVGACPLLTFGPIFVETKEQDKWRQERDATEARVAKLGLGLSVITDGAINTDRSLFLDSYEHPTLAERTAWTNRVIGRLVSQSQSPCAKSLAKAEVPPARS